MANEKSKADEKKLQPITLNMARIHSLTLSIQDKLAEWTKDNGEIHAYELSHAFSWVLVNFGIQIAEPQHVIVITSPSPDQAMPPIDPTKVN